MKTFNFIQSLGFALNRTTLRMRNELLKKFKANMLDISVDNWVILNRLWEKDGWTQSELANMTYKDKASMTRIIDGMEKKRLLERKPDPFDRRVYKIFLTNKGREMKDQLSHLAKENMEQAIKGFSEKELEILFEQLDRIYNNFDR